MLSEFEGVKIICLTPVVYQFCTALSTRQWIWQKVIVFVGLTLPHKWQEIYKSTEIQLFQEVVASAAISCCSHEYQWQAWWKWVVQSLGSRRPFAEGSHESFMMLHVTFRLCSILKCLKFGERSQPPPQKKRDKTCRHSRSVLVSENRNQWDCLGIW